MILLDNLKERKVLRTTVQIWIWVYSNVVDAKVTVTGYVTKWNDMITVGQPHSHHHVNGFPSQFSF